MENVPTVAESRQFSYLIERLESIGYECSAIIANSAWPWQFTASTVAAVMIAVRDRLRGWGGRIRNFGFRMIVIEPERFAEGLRVSQFAPSPFRLSFARQLDALEYGGVCYLQHSGDSPNAEPLLS
jgi:uncharacterized membrane protein YedE/YeeE